MVVPFPWGFWAVVLVTWLWRILPRFVWVAEKNWRHSFIWVVGLVLFPLIWEV